MSTKQTLDDKAAKSLTDVHDTGSRILEKKSFDTDSDPLPDSLNAQKIDDAVTDPSSHGKPVIESLLRKDSLDGDPSYIVVGKFGRTHGLDGKLFVHSYTEPIANLFSYDPLFLGNQSVISFLSHQKHGKNIVCQPEGITDCDAARKLINQLIYLHTDQLEKLPDGQYYWHQLTGCGVVSDTGHTFGVVDYMYSGAQFPIMVVKDPQSNKKTEHLIPYEPSTVKAVDMDKRQIVVDWLID